MKGKVQREMLSQKAGLFSSIYVCSPRQQCFNKFTCRNGSLSLCALKKGSLTVEAALIVPFFLTILLAFFSYFLQYAFAADLQIQAAAEAKQVGIVLGSTGASDQGRVVIYKSGKWEPIWKVPFFMKTNVTEKAVCRAWIGFTELETEDTYVYITPEGSVYHLYRDCTHLDLSIQRVSFEKASTSKNDYGERYRECELCEEPMGLLVYITNEGNCYHSERTCSGLKRTVRQVPMSEVMGRTGCLRCLSRGE